MQLAEYGITLEGILRLVFVGFGSTYFLKILQARLNPHHLNEKAIIIIGILLFSSSFFILIGGLLTTIVIIICSGIGIVLNLFSYATMRLFSGIFAKSRNTKLMPTNSNIATSNISAVARPE